MASSRISKKSLIKEIEDAFADTELAPEEPLVTDPNNWEADDVIRAFQGKHWKDISLKELYLNRLAIPLFTAKAFHFYMPAFLVKPLLARGNSTYRSGEITEMAFYNLIPPHTDNPYELKKLLEQMEEFTPEQEAAIRSFIIYYMEQGSPYVENLWGKEIKEFWKI